MKSPHQVLADAEAHMEYARLVVTGADMAGVPEDEAERLLQVLHRAVARYLAAVRAAGLDEAEALAAYALGWDQVAADIIAHHGSGPDWA